MNRNKHHWLGIDLGGTKMAAAVFDDDMTTPLASAKCPTLADGGMDDSLERLFLLIRQTLKDANVSPDLLSGIGAGCPGPLDLNKGILLKAGNLNWTNVHLKELLENNFKCPAVILNDVDAGVYAEFKFGAARNSHCVLGVFPGTGIGGGCIYEGNIIRGKNSSVMEIGHVQVLQDGPLCSCGRRGCVEAVASRLAIAAEAATAARRGLAPWLLAHAGTDIELIQAATLADAIRNGDTAIADIVRHAASMIGVAVGNVVNLLGPDVVVLGGGLPEAMPDIFRAEVDEAARNRVMPGVSASFRVAIALLGPRATVTGAAAWAAATAGMAT